MRRLTLAPNRREGCIRRGTTPFGYIALGKEIGYMGYSPIDDDIHDGVLEHEALGDPAIQAIVDKLKKHPIIGKDHQTCSDSGIF
jgi:hypothetical protein